MKVMSISASAAAFRDMLSILQQYYVEGRYEGLSLVAGEEWSLNAGPFAMRNFEEYSVKPPGGREWRLAAARRALLEERPDLLLTSAGESDWDGLGPLCRQLGCCWVRCQGSVEAEGWTMERLTPPAPQPVPPRQDAPLSLAEDPTARLRELLSERTRFEFSEPVNLAFEGSLHRFCYGEYDNEFALAPATHDLSRVLRSQLKPDQFRVTVAPNRTGTAGDSPYLEANDGLIPRFCVEIDQAGLPARHWSDRFADGARAQMRLLLVDLYNVAGSGMQHAQAINRYSKSTAHVLCKEPHPFIEPAGPDCNVVYTGPGWSDEIKQLLIQADVLAFFEEDDGETLDWPESFRQIARTKPSLHFYVGQRVHTGVAARQRPDKMVLAALPHILRMYPQSKFYAGFYPPVLEDLQLRPPLSSQDGILRVLHTPSLPHPTLHRYLYHKDTGAFLEAAQVLKARHPTVQFLQLAGVPHGKILRARQDCDIAFHQLRGFMGMTGNEAMFLRRPCVQAFDRANLNRHLEYWGLDCRFPWLHADRTTLVEVLDRLICDADHRAEVAQDGRFFMLQNFNAQVGIQVYLYYALQAVEGRS
jgi:hypothetical protein